MRKIKWGILGCAAIAFDRFIPALQLACNAELYAIASRSTEKVDLFGQKFSPVCTYSSYDDLLNDAQVEIVYIPLPNTLHYEWVKKAADKGKHILCEKPLAMNERDAEEMYTYCESKNVVLMEAFAYRHSPLVKKIKEVIDLGTIGKIKLIESHHTAIVSNSSNIRMDATLGGGAFYDMTCYNISFISYILESEPIKICALQELADSKNVDISNSIIMLFANGCQAFSYAAINCYPKGSISIIGEKGRIEVPFKFNCKNMAGFTVATNVRAFDGMLVDEIKTEYSFYCPNNFMLEIEQMGRYATGLEKAVVSKEETLRNIRIMDIVLSQVEN